MRLPFFQCAGYRHLELPMELPQAEQGSATRKLSLRSVPFQTDNSYQT